MDECIHVCVHLDTSHVVVVSFHSAHYWFEKNRPVAPVAQRHLVTLGHVGT